MKRILFIESSDIGVRHTAEGTRILGFEPLFVVNLNGAQGDTRKQFEEERKKGCVVDCTTTNAALIIAALKSNNIDLKSIAATITFLDSRLNLAKELNSLLKCEYDIDDAIPYLKSKDSVSKLIPEFSPPSITTAKNPLDLSELRSFLEEHNKIIIKPTQLAGAIGTKIFDSTTPEEILCHINSQNLPQHLDEEKWVCQSFIEGKLYSAEGFVLDNKITHLGVSNRKKIEYTESHLCFPSDDELSPEDLSTYKNVVAHIISRSGFKNGFFHVEFILKNGKCNIIDANMGRLGGGPLGEMIPLSYGIKPEYFFSFVICISLGIKNNLVKNLCAKFDLKEKQKTVGLCYGSKESAYLKSIEIQLSKATSFHTQVLDNDQVVPRMGLDNWSWIGILSTLEKDFDKIMQSFKLVLKDREETPCY